MTGKFELDIHNIRTFVAFIIIKNRALLLNSWPSSLLSNISEFTVCLKHRLQSNPSCGYGLRKLKIYRRHFRLRKLYGYGFRKAESGGVGLGNCFRSISGRKKQKRFYLAAETERIQFYLFPQVFRNPVYSALTEMTYFLSFVFSNYKHTCGINFSAMTFNPFPIRFRTTDWTINGA